MKGHIRGSLRALLLGLVVCLLAVDVSISVVGAETSGASSSPAAKGAGFAPVIVRQPPAVDRGTWVRNPIDRFILARLEKQGLLPAPEASREALIRQAYLDLIGLPPTPQQADDFIADPLPDAYETVVDRLLALPQYGERWGRHWVRFGRYAHSEGV